MPTAILGEREYETYEIVWRELLECFPEKQNQLASLRSGRLSAPACRDAGARTRPGTAAQKPRTDGEG
jgi:hypothetical protein